MKNLFPMLFLGALALMTATLASCEKDTEASSQEYAVTVTAGPGGKAEAKIEGTVVAKAPEGALVILSATPDEGFTFSRWIAESGSATLSDPASGLATFTMPAQDVSLRAEFVKGEIDVFDKMIDPIFEEFCRNYLKLDTNGDGILSLEEAQSIRELNVNELDKLFGQAIFSLAGIEYFTSLTKLTCYGNAIEELDLTANTELTYLHVATNKLSKLDVTKNTKLTELYVSRNKIAEIDLSKCPDLQIFQSEQCTELPALDFSKNPELMKISIYGCPKISSLDFSNNPKLTVAQCYANNLTTLNVANCTELEALNCFDNQLTELELPDCPKLTVMDCRGNQLTSLDVSHATALIYLMCYDNRMTELDASHMAKPDDFTLCCGVQTSDGTTPQTLRLTLRDEQKPYWQYHLASSVDNADVELAGGLTNLFETITDPIFKAYCEQFDTDNDGFLSQEEAVAVTEINVPNMKIASLAGIEIFTGLKRLVCNNNELTTLFVAYNPALEELICEENQLTELILSKGLSGGEELLRVDCQHNQLTKLSVAGCKKLTTLNCQNNQIADLNMNFSYSLSKINCSNNKLTNLDFYQKNEINTLNCTYNELTSLNLSGKTTLTSVMCDHNPMTTLNISGCTALAGVMAYECRLTELDASQMANPEGYNLYCGKQTSDGETAQTLTLTLREEQIPLWNSNMKDFFLNEGVVLAE